MSESVQRSSSSQTTGAVPLGPRFTVALGWAAELHANQRRKGDGPPYVGHLLAVAALVIEDGGSEDEAIAALLHDAAEDQGGERTLEMIRSRFGEDVAQIVRECSDSLIDTRTGEKDDWEVRKHRYLENLEHASPEARRVALADKVHNVRTMVRDQRRTDDPIFDRFTETDPKKQIAHHRKLADAFKRLAPGVLADELEAGVEELLGLIPEVI